MKLLRNINSLKVHLDYLPCGEVQLPVGNHYEEFKGNAQDVSCKRCKRHLIEKGGEGDGEISMVLQQKSENNS